MPAITSSIARTARRVPGPSATPTARVTAASRSAYKHHTDPELRRALEKWLAAETEGMQDRLEAVRAAAEVARLAAQVLDQRVMEARVHNWAWSDIAESVGITRQSAHKRWRHLEPRARALAEAEEASFRSSRWPPNASWTRTGP